MTTIYNTEPAKIDLECTQGDAISLELYINTTTPDFSMWQFHVQVNSAPVVGIPFPMTTVRMRVKRKDGLLLKDWISGVSPADITIALGSIHLFDIDGFLESGFFDYDLECNNGVGVFTIMSGTFHVKKQV